MRAVDGGDLRQARRRMSELATVLEGCTDPIDRAGHLQWCGNLWFAHGHRDRALEAYRLSSGVAERSGDRKGIARADAAIARVMILSRTPAEREIGAAKLGSVMTEKRRLGDWTNLDDDFLAMAGYAYERDRVGRALGYAHRALRIADIYGRPHAALDALDLLATIDLRGGRWRAVENFGTMASKIASRFHEPALQAKATEIRTKIADAFRNRKGPNVAVPCWCEKVSSDPARDTVGHSPPSFEACCGRADREPYEMNIGYCATPAIFDRAVSGHPDPVLTLADYARPWEGTDGPFGFLRAEYFDGWVEMHSLPHMARYHLKAAQDACDRMDPDGSDIGSATSAVILAVCGIEAFLNGVVQFAAIEDPASDPRMKLRARKAKPELVLRWKILGARLCREGWNPPGIEASFLRLVDLRNGLVHSKPRWEEASAPRSITMKRARELSPGEMKRLLTPWQPERELTPDLARWAVGVADTIIREFGSHIGDAGSTPGADEPVSQPS